jgi:glycosyltransferase involved in cell wall biosynthesis
MRLLLVRKESFNRIGIDVIDPINYKQKYPASMNPAPSVSVIIPTFNSGQYIATAVDSALAQERVDVEVLVIDDGSTDATGEILRRYGDRIHYIYQPNSGVSTARNTGLASARSRYLAFLDSDDAWHPNKLARQLDALEKNPDAGACYSAFTVTDSELSPLYIHRGEPETTVLEDLLLKGNWVSTPSTVLCERALFTKVGGFDPELSLCADWDMWLRLAAVTDFVYIDESLADYRKHGENMSGNVALLERDSLRVLEKGFAMPGLSGSLRAKRLAALAHNDMVLAGSYFQTGCYRGFLRCATRSVAGDFRQAGHLIGFPFRQLQPRNLA